MSAIRVRDGIVVKEFSSLVNPKCLIPKKIMDITGINNAMVADAPTIENVLPEYLDFLSDDIIVGYNLTTFDYNVIL